jgi:hypothetical protein
MIMARKTVEVEKIKNRVNRLIENTLDDPAADDTRMTLAILIEGILLDTGNYKGFRYLDIEFEDGEVKTYGNLTRRHYH